MPFKYANLFSISYYYVSQFTYSTGLIHILKTISYIFIDIFIKSFIQLKISIGQAPFLLVSWRTMVVFYIVIRIISIFFFNQTHIYHSIFSLFIYCLNHFFQLNILILLWQIFCHIYFVEQYFYGDFWPLITLLYFVFCWS